MLNSKNKLPPTKYMDLKTNNLSKRVFIKVLLCYIIRLSNTPA